MGGVFSAPKVKTPSPAELQAAEEAAAAKARKESQDRRRRGLESNIKTSAVGILSDQPGGYTRKNLLGE